MGRIAGFLTLASPERTMACASGCLLRSRARRGVLGLRRSRKATEQARGVLRSRASATARRKAAGHIRRATSAMKQPDALFRSRGREDEPVRRNAHGGRLPAWREILGAQCADADPDRARVSRSTGRRRGRAWVDWDCPLRHHRLRIANRKLRRSSRHGAESARGALPSRRTQGATTGSSLCTRSGQGIESAALRTSAVERAAVCSRNWRGWSEAHHLPALDHGVAGGESTRDRVESPRHPGGGSDRHRRDLRSSTRLDVGAGSIGRPTDDVAGPTLFEALDAQLGLKLKRTRLPQPVIVVDRVERMPVEN